MTKLTMHTISEPEKIVEIQPDLDAFVRKNTTNPFMLSAFIKETMKTMERSKEHMPLILVFRADSNIVGLAPLKLKLNLRFAEWLFSYAFSPDFIFDNAYREVCMQKSVEVIFNAHYNFLMLDIPENSSNRDLLAAVSKNKKLRLQLEENANLNHYLISVDNEWSKFEKRQGAKFRHHFKKIETKLNKHGSWRIVPYEGLKNEEETLQKISEIEKHSWKQKWRSQNNLLFDEDLLMLWAASNSATRSFPDFKRYVRFLELNDQPIAYSMAIQYRDRGYIVKTSYNAQYRKLYPSIYALNETIKDFFNKKVSTIDFMTALPFMTRWTSDNQGRLRGLISKGALPNLIIRSLHQPLLRKTAWKLSNTNSSSAFLLNRI